MIPAIATGWSISIHLCGSSGRDWNTTTQVSRYSDSGSTHSSGAAATSVEICAVTAISRPDGTAARKIQRSRVTSVGAGAFASSACSVGHRQLRRAQQQHAAGGDQQDQNTIAAGPEPVLRVQREHRLQQERIGQQREEAADVGGGIEEIGIAAIGMAGADEPGLQQRIVGGEREER